MSRGQVLMDVDIAVKVLIVVHDSEALVSDAVKCHMFSLRI